MTRLLPAFLLRLLVSCAPVQDPNASVLNEAGEALGVLTGTDHGNTDTVTVAPPDTGLERVRLDLEAVDPLAVEHEACESLEEVVSVCAWEVLTEPATITFMGDRVNGAATYRVPGDTAFRWEFLRY